MTDLAPLSSRHLPAAPTGTTMPDRAPAMTLSEVERVCNMIATGGDLVPPAYRGKPGAVLLAKLWADANGIDLFTAMQNISPIEGKPYVSAEMRVAMATARGFEFRVTESNREVCTVDVWRGDELRGRITARYADSPRKLKTSKGYDTPWATHPDDMLFAEACRKADRRYVKTAAALLDVAQDYAVEPDPLEVLGAAATLAQDAAEAGAEPEPTSAPEPPASTAPEPVTVDATDGQVEATADEREAFLLNAASSSGIKRPRVELLKLAQGLGHQVGTIADLVANPTAYNAVLDHLQDGQQ